MADHPSTFRGATGELDQIDWADRATIHLRDQGDGILQGMTALHSGSFAEMVEMIARMPAANRQAYVIQKAGDRLFGPAEIAELAARGDFPHRSPTA